MKADDILFAIRVGYLPIEESMEIFDIGIYAQSNTGENVSVPI